MIKIIGIMNISLIDVDGHGGFPNLALMKISAWHKAQGDNVEWYSPLFSNPDKIYMSKVFTFTRDYMDLNPAHPEPERGGTGYDIHKKLPEAIERMKPDYSIYPNAKESYGFLTRGCIRRCEWCVVPEKEGDIRAVADIRDIAGDRKSVVLMDNNFLAANSHFVKTQLNIIIQNKIRVDFNQGLDARLVYDNVANLLAQIKWIDYPRFACDTQVMIQPVKNAITKIRKHGYTGRVFVYVLAKELEEALSRINELCSFDKEIVPFCQPYRDFTNIKEPPRELKRLARWCNFQAIRKTVEFKDYKG